jgi:hypothetical protein
MSKDEKKGSLHIELQRDLGFKGVLLGKGFVMEAEDRAWAEHLVAMGDAKEVPAPDKAPEKPWEVALAEAVAEAKAKHPTEARGFGNAPKK